MKVVSAWNPDREVLTAWIFIPVVLDASVTYFQSLLLNMYF
jgi:hypothetical protein